MSTKLPPHIGHVPDKRQAIAPYNFVELPDKIVEAEPLPEGDRYHSDRHTGKIECTLTTSSPLYIRCGLTISDFKEGKESKDNPEFFYTADKLRPVIPGSSLRGMLRTLVEIITFSKIDRVAGQDRFFFRAVAADKDDPLKEIYSDNHKNIKAGYLNKDSQDRWFIVPAKEPSEKESYISFKEKEFKNDLPSLITMEKSDYLPQYIPVSVNISANGRITAISEDTSKLDIKGHLVTSGNMLETSSLTESERLTKLNEKSGRKKHYVVLDKNNLKPAIYIEKYAVDNYCNSLTSFQDGKLFESNPKNPFSNKMGLFEINRPIFYCQPAKGKLVTLFGQSPNFRIPFSPLGDGQAATARDFIPEVLKDPEGEDEGREPVIDVAEGIFGYVRGNKFENQARSGRVSISAATCISTDDVWYEQEPIIPKILASPKPTTFQHYLVQSEDTKAEKSKLKHYGNQGTVIRGHKLYWHQKSTPKIKHPNPEEAAEKQATQITKIKPIKAGVSFKFNVHFENLSNIELGALLWILDIAQDDDYRLSLGMGKPLGMGAVKIEYQLYLSKRQSRYESLFANKAWEISEKAESDSGFVSEFENYMAVELEHIGSFKKHRRIQMLLSMLNWQNIPKVTETRYMEIEREEKPLHSGDSNEYKARYVLPSPLDVRDSDRKNNKDVQDSDRLKKVSPPNPVVIKKADSELSPSISSDESPSKPIQKYQVGEIVKATITKISGNDVTYEFADATKRTEKKCKQAGFLQDGQGVFVKVVAIKDDGSMKNVKYDRA